jgi:PAS domain S-box-containing protein
MVAKQAIVLNALNAAKPVGATGRILLAPCAMGAATAVLISLETAFSPDAHHALLVGTATLCTLAGFVIILCSELCARSEKLKCQTKELQQLADALRASEARFRDFALTASDWFWETDSEHRFTYTSDSIRLFGQNPDSRIGRTRIDLAADSEEEPQKWREHITTLNRHQPFRDFVYTRKIGAEPEQILSVSGSPYFDEAGHFIGYRGTARDVTEKVQAEHRLSEAKLAAEAANIAKGRFLANMSHELRTPLNAILGFSDMMVRALKGPLRSEYQDYGRMIHQSGRHLLAIIDDVLDLAKIDAGQLVLDDAPTDLRELILDTVNLLSAYAQQNQVALSVNPACLPMFRGDPRRLRQVLLNLTSNAIKFTEPGGQVTVHTQEMPDRDLCIEVRDTGIGMTEAEIATAMRAFEQVDPGLNRRHQGTGLGLPLARALVQLHGGALQIESQKGCGTTIRVRLPRSRLCRTEGNRSQIAFRM